MKREPAVHVDIFAALIPGGGIGRYARQIVRALETRPDAPPHRFLVTRNTLARARPEFPAERLIELRLAWRELSAANMIGTKLGWRFDALYGHPAVVHSPGGYGPRFRHARLINHVHDLTYWTHPEWHTRKTAWLQSVTAPAACRSAARIVTSCQHVRNEVVHYFGIDPARIEVFPLPLDPGLERIDSAQARAHVAQRFGVAGPYVLHVSTIEPRKNQVRLIEAYEELRRAGFPGPLVMAGQDGWRFAPVLARLQASAFAREILRIRDADDRDLSALYGAATLTAFPSLEEGFGYPLLESMAHGTPCVTSDHPSLVELAGGAAICVPATDTGAIAEAMIRLWQDEAWRARWSEAGIARARAFGFGAWADRMLAVYREELAAAAAG